MVEPDSKFLEHILRIAFVVVVRHSDNKHKTHLNMAWNNWLEHHNY